MELALSKGDIMPQDMGGEELESALEILLMAIIISKASLGLYFSGSNWQMIWVLF